MRKAISKLMMVCLALLLTFALSYPAAAITSASYSLIFDPTSGALYSCTIDTTTFDVTVTGDVSGAYSGWSASGTTLSLNGFNFTTTADIGLVVPDGTTVALADDSQNSITCRGQTSGISAALVCATVSGGGVTMGELTITGGALNTGTLAIKGCDFSAASVASSNIFVECCVYANTLTLSGGKLFVTPGDVTYTDCHFNFISAGIYAEDEITVGNAELTVNTWDATVNRDEDLPAGNNWSSSVCSLGCSGLFAYGDITISGTVSSLAAQAVLNRAMYVNFVNAGITSSAGAYSFSGSVTTAGGSIDSTDSLGSNVYSDGIYGAQAFGATANTLTVSAGTLTAAGGDVTVSLNVSEFAGSTISTSSVSGGSGSIAIGCDLSLTGGSVTATGGDVTANGCVNATMLGSCGVFGDSTISGGQLTATAGSITKTNSSSSGRYFSVGSGGDIDISAASGVSQATAAYSGSTITNNDADNTTVLASVGVYKLSGSVPSVSVGDRAYLTFEGNTAALTCIPTSPYSYNWRHSSTGSFVSSSSTSFSVMDSAQSYYTYIEFQPGLVQVADISAPAAVYDGETLTLSAPSVSYNGYTGNSTAWQYSASASGPWTSFNPATRAFISSENGYYLRYLVTYELDSNTTSTAASNNVQIAVATRVLTVSGTTVAAKVYSASGATTATIGTVSGIQSGDSVTVSVASATYTDLDVSDHAQAWVVYTLSGDDASHYSVASSLVYGIITPMQLSVNYPASIQLGYDPRGMTYNGTATQSGTLSAVMLVGELAADNLTVTATAVFDNKNVGTGKSVSISYTMSGTDAGNYTAPAADSRTDGEITQSYIYVNSINADRTYDGTDDSTPVLSWSTPVNQANEDVDIVLTGTFDSKDVGTARIVTFDNVPYLSGADAGNYLLLMGAYSNATQLTGVKITAKQLVVVSASVDNKTYDGTLTANITVGEVQGIIAGDDVTVSATGTFVDKNAGENKAVNITYSLSGADAGNYLAPGTQQATATITKKPVTVESDGTYSGGSHDLSSGSVSGVVSGDQVSAGGSVSTSGTGSYSAVSGGYLTGSDAANYEITLITGEISQKVLHVTGTPVVLDKVYDGTKTAAAGLGTLALDTTEIISGDEVILGVAGTFSTANAGTNLNVNITCVLTGSAADNYVLSASFTLHADITAKSLSVSGSSATNKVYDGSTTAAVTVGTVSGLLANDNVTVSAAGSFNNKDVGTAKPVSVTYTLSGSAAGNYTAPAAESLSADITVKSLSVSGSSAANKVYDGSTAAAVTVGTVSGIATNDNVTVSAAGSFNNKDVGTAKPVSVTYTLSGSAAGNYAAPAAGSLSADITAISLTITGSSAADKVYDGSTAATISAGTVSGILGNDDVAVAAAGSFNNKDVGTAKPVSVTYTLSGSAAGNYTAPAAESLSADITAVSLTITGSSAADKVYDGSTAAAVTAGTVSGIVANDSVTVTAAGTFNNKDVGTAKPVSVTYTLSGSAAGNYTAPAAESLSADINPKTIGKPSISGQVQIGSTLSVVLDPADAAVTCQWYVDSVLTSTQSSYVLSTADAGKSIYVSVTGSGNFSGTQVSDAIQLPS